jgi:hypothetical protein
MRFEFIGAEKPNYPLAMLCRVMQVSRGGLELQRKSGHFV